MKTSILESWRAAGDAIRLGGTVIRTGRLPALEGIEFKEVQDYAPTVDGWATDGENLAGDWRRVGDYLRTAMNRWDETHEQR